MGNTRPQGVRNLRIRSSVARARRPRSRVTVAPRSFLDAGTAVLPGDRKFLDYAFPPLQTPTDVVTNTGGRVGWHRSPLPGPLFPRPRSLVGPDAFTQIASARKALCRPQSLAALD